MSDPGEAPKRKYDCQGEEPPAPAAQRPRIGLDAAPGASEQNHEKDFYREHPDVSARTDEEVEAYRKEREIHITGSDVPKPVTTFEEANFPGEPPDSSDRHC